LFKARLPKRSWRKPGVRGILALSPKYDPMFDIVGLPNPFAVYFPASITNLYSATIYVTALLLSPPAGWNDSEQNVTSLTVGASARVEKSNATRNTPSAGTNETITCRWNYRTGSYAGPIIGYDDFQILIYWENISLGTVDDVDSFEDPQNPNPPYDFDGWVPTRHCVSDTITRDSTVYVHGAWSLRLWNYQVDHWGEIQKSRSVGAGSRAGIFGFLRVNLTSRTCLKVTAPYETIEFALVPANTWRRFGFRLTPDAGNTVTIRANTYWGGSDQVNLDYIRWVRFA